MQKRTNTAVWSEKYKRWKISVQQDGVRKSFYSCKAGRIGQREANAKADKWLDSGRGVGAIRRIRVEDAIDEYRRYRAELVAAKKGIRAPQIKDIKGKDLGCYRSDLSLLDNWLRPKCGTRWLDSLNDGDIQFILDLASAAGRKKKTIKDLKHAILQMLKYFRRLGLTDYRPDEVDIPVNARSEKQKILQPDDLQRLFSREETKFKGRCIRDDFLYAYRLQVLIGLRPGELIGLRWEDISKDSIHICRSVNDAGETTKGKNENAIRTIELFGLAKEQLKLQQLASGSRRGTVFKIESQRQYRDHWYRYCEHNGFARVTPYQLRHTFVSIVQKLPEGIVKRLVGHSKSMDTFGVYGHEFGQYAQEAAGELSAIFSEVLASNNFEK